MQEARNILYGAHARSWRPAYAWCFLRCMLLPHRLQQLQGKPVTVPPGAPASMADTSKLLVLIEALTAAAPSSKATAGAPTAAAAAGAVTGRAGSAGAPGGPAAARPSAAGGKGAPATPAMSKAEQVGNVSCARTHFAMSTAYLQGCLAGTSYALKGPTTTRQGCLLNRCALYLLKATQSTN